MLAGVPHSKLREGGNATNLDEDDGFEPFLVRGVRQELRGGGPNNQSQKEPKSVLRCMFNTCSAVMALASASLLRNCWVCNTAVVGHAFP
eukprot:CAMPEP_0175851530 /NCGR_PEP_ID=MMETSP0107_2-20121207/25707_1 /TAXON_ID=195067 ORGANISM="Goniomonas pacifica, Strain CCMP1869" /NCGR_SAMPLE_ID=MMETSP0107_2 /ASSEMBLY_ACC=CAM_ASM_000203 /LENGTH=89 /DNA_ID=CAMNT_0017166961 /DNA_START=81 /DNA_END=347 /DNA_ORIENTATION=-